MLRQSWSLAMLASIAMCAGQACMQHTPTVVSCADMIMVELQKPAFLQSHLLARMLFMFMHGFEAQKAPAMQPAHGNGPGPTGLRMRLPYLTGSSNVFVLRGM